MSRILIVEDEVAIADLEKDYLELSGFEVEIENDGTKGLERALHEEFDLFILDLMLPGVDGFEICKKIRETKNTPILMVSAKKDDIDKIRGLGLGADDYVTKPFGMMELVSRIKAVLRRTGRIKTDTSELEINGVKMDLKKHEVTADGKTIVLTLKEFELLEKLMKNQNIVLTRDQLLTDIWGYDFDGETRTVDVHIRTLRQKLGEYGSMIETIRGVGYRIGETNER